MDDDVSAGGQASSSSSAAVGVTAAEEPSIRAWFKTACVTTSQKVTLYDNSTLTLSCISDFRAHQGRVQLFCYNKTNFDFSRTEVVVGTVEELVVRQQGPAVVISAGDEGRVMLAIDCMKPFEGPVPVTVSFYLGGMPYKYNLNLPITIASFFEPIPTDKATYMARWKALDNEVQEVFTSEQQFSHAVLGQLRNTIFTGLKFGPAAELDVTEKSITGSCSFRTGTAIPGDASGNLVSVGAMMRLEADPAQSRFRITVRSKHPKVSSAIKEIIKSHAM